MARALENKDRAPTYLDYFGMTQPPFAQLADARSPIFLSEQYSLLMSQLCSVTEQSDCLMVICGADGSGKTTLLNRYVATLSNEVSYATFDETCKNGTQFYCSFLRQLGFSEISGSLQELRRITQEFLLHMGKDGDPILVIIDNAQLVSPSVYEQLRWIAETKSGDRRVLSIVLAGNSDLPRVMKSPAMSKLRFRNNVNFNIRVYSEIETEDYVRHRLRLSGGIEAAKFSNDARPLIHELTGGVPNSINLLCNEVLAEAYANETRVISADLVRLVAESHDIKPAVARRKGKGRRKTDPDFKLEKADEQPEARIAPRHAPAAAVVTNPEGETEVVDAAVAEHLDKIGRLSEQLGEMKAEKKQMTRDITQRDKVIARLQKQLDTQAAKFAEQSSAARKSTEENRQLKKALSDTTKALRKSETAARKPAPTSKTRDAVVKKLSTQVDQLSEQLGVLEAAGKQAHIDIEARDGDIARLKEEASESMSALRESEKEVMKLVSDLKKEERASKRATTEANKAKARVDKIQGMKVKLQETVKGLKADLKEANKKATKVHALEKNSEELKGKIESKTGQLTARDKALGETEDALRKSKSECDELRQRVEDLETELAESKKAPKKKSKRKHKGKDQEVGQNPDTIKTLEIILDGDVQQVLEIESCPARIMIGRSEDNELRLDSKFVSRHHALLSCTDGRVLIEDLNSYNGVVVNSKSVASHEMRPDDKILIGDFVIRPRRGE